MWCVDDIRFWICIWIVVESLTIVSVLVLVSVSPSKAPKSKMTMTNLSLFWVIENASSVKWLPKTKCGKDIHFDLLDEDDNEEETKQSNKPTTTKPQLVNSFNLP